ncbi:hypothetical protein PVAP13_6NG068100 [Panicum virgatum]|uniref:Uncharacterized protein n=1 Tax=Panicum virgatum TaxID=38727 RepID=A0A8T0QW91_PANVG|nr:hypothetical protein PVAP13_6NG068100 [Panicum virgatum]
MAKHTCTAGKVFDEMSLARRFKGLKNWQLE